MSRKVAAQVTELALPLAAELNLELVEVEYTKEAGRYYLRVFIDKPGGVTLDDCQALSERLGVLLDEADPIPNPYFLEVSSPGIERPLKKAGDFERFAGREARVKTFAPVEGRRQFKGRLLGANEEEVRMEVAGRVVVLPLKNISSARLAHDF
ncbi:MAG: ribosome maturation factor RimP [Desulfotomaculales bacterium]